MNAFLLPCHNNCACQRAPTSSKRTSTRDRSVLAVLKGFLERIWPHMGITAKQEKTLAKVQVTVKAVETANRMMQLTRASDRAAPSGYWVVKPLTPSPLAIAQAGERALKSLKK